MIRAYNKTYLLHAQNQLAVFLDYSVNYLNYSLKDIWKKFLDSDVYTGFFYADPTVIAGRSGIELVYDVLKKEPNSIPEYNSIGKSREFWLGYYLAYFHWYTSIDFRSILIYLPIEELLEMYSAYHEMDYSIFVKRVTEMLNERKVKTNLEIIRKIKQLSRSELSEASNVPVRVIEHYEQRQININKASSEYVLALAKSLRVKPEELLEPIL